MGSNAPSSSRPTSCNRSHCLLKCMNQSKNTSSLIKEDSRGCLTNLPLQMLLEPPIEKLYRALLTLQKNVRVVDKRLLLYCITNGNTLQAIFAAAKIIGSITRSGSSPRSSGWWTA